MHQHIRYEIPLVTKPSSNTKHQKTSQKAIDVFPAAIDGSVYHCAGSVIRAVALRSNVTTEITLGVGRSRMMLENQRMVIVLRDMLMLGIEVYRRIHTFCRVVGVDKAVGREKPD